MTSTTYSWPDGKRIAVAVTAMLETWSEGKAPPYGVQASPIKAGVDRPRRHRLGQLWRQGRRVADHRSAQPHGIRGTFCVNARCAEIFPEAVDADRQVRATTSPATAICRTSSWPT